jgi:hypothetical protein
MMMMMMMMMCYPLTDNSRATLPALFKILFAFYPEGENRLNFSSVKQRR